MKDWTENDIKLYSQQFNNLNSIVGHSIDQIDFYLKPTDKELSEQSNMFGKSLFNGIDIKVGNKFYSVGCRFINSHNGLTISEGQTTELEFIEEEKSAVTFDTKIIGQKIKSADIYWMKIPWNEAVGYYPQEYVIRTEKDFLLISSIEINSGEVNTEFTDELLVIESEETAKQLQLGPYGLGDNGRVWFKNFDELNDSDKKNWL
jgi:hypothetical protein